MINVAFGVQNEVKRVLELQQSYRSLPMSLADACLVCMAEQSSRCRVLTTDSHFRGPDLSGNQRDTFGDTFR